MLEFTFTSQFRHRNEIVKEIRELLWQAEFLWPAGELCENQMKWIKGKIERNVLKVSGGSRRISIDTLKGK